MLCENVVAVIMNQTIPLAIFTMRKAIHNFLRVWGSTSWLIGLLELHYNALKFLSSDQQMNVIPYSAEEVISLKEVIPSLCSCIFDINCYLFTAAWLAQLVRASVCCAGG